jgi:GNAT superfamily N-acetyltransferase/uncharacterized glyoxalase superfamily protein PhnB
MTEPVFSHAEPMLQVSNVIETVKYWQDVLGFPNQWTWGDPPSHGGVSWHGAFIQFSHNPEFAERAPGQSIWIRVTHIDILYTMHQQNGADIVMPLAKQPYGFDEYVIRDLNGNYVAFASPASGKVKKSENMPASVKITGRPPTPDEYRNLIQSVGWSTSWPEDMLQKQLNQMQYAVIAENVENGEVIGCALLMGDGFSFYYVKDVMVHPEWQGKRVGTAIMQEISSWLDDNAPNKALVGLYANETLKPFYQQFHFGPAFGMIRIIDKKINQ